MNSPRQLLLREVQLAYMLGFLDVEPFRRALRSGEVLAPSEYVAGKPVWYVSEIERRYGEGFIDGSVAVDESDVLDRIESIEPDDIVRRSARQRSLQEIG